MKPTIVKVNGKTYVDWGKGITANPKPQPKRGDPFGIDAAEWLPQRR